MHEAVAKFGREADSARRYKDQMIEAGFENVVEIVYKWPQNRWPKDPKLKELGKIPPILLVFFKRFEREGSWG